MSERAGGVPPDHTPVVPPTRIGRRTALRWFGGAGAWAALQACSSSDSSSTTTATAPSGSTASTTGSSTADAAPDATTADLPAAGIPLGTDPVHLRLWAEPTMAEIVTGTSTEVWSFGAEVLEGDDRAVAPSDSYLGPTLHVRQGQQVRVTFENRLPDQPSIVHWHGLVVPQDQDGQPAEAVPPGETYEYDFEVSNEPGTYWYHPHPHQLTGEQVYRGLAGLLVVHGPDDGPDAALPSGANDLALVLQDRTIGSDGSLRYVATRHDEMAGFVGATPVANGRADYAVSVRPEPYRLRLLNGANSATTWLTWSNGEPMHVVATDGALLPSPVSAPGVAITPAQRTDLWVDFSTVGPGAELRLLAATIATEGGMGMGGGIGDGVVVATFRIDDAEPRPGSLPDRFGEEPLLDTPVNPDDPKQFVLSTFRAAHWINDTRWEGRAATELETVRAGTVELWEFVNRSPMLHPMHLHGRAFRVVERSWDDDFLADTWRVIEDGVVETGWRDTVLVLPGQRVRIAVPFAEHLGYFLYHCHILEHEDQGMMRNFRVV